MMEIARRSENEEGSQESIIALSVRGSKKLEATDAPGKLLSYLEKQTTGGPQVSRNSRAHAGTYSQLSKQSQDSMKPCKINFDQISKPLKIIKTPHPFRRSQIENAKMKSFLRENSRDVKYRIPFSGIVKKSKI